MIDRIIAEYMGANRRLVIPNLGAFIRKDPGNIVFIPFLKKDDGVLQGLISESLALSAQEAEGMISEYVSGISARLSPPSGYVIEGLGRLKNDVNGIAYLDYDTSMTAAAGITTEEPTAAKTTARTDDFVGGIRKTAMVTQSPSAQPATPERKPTPASPATHVGTPSGTPRPAPAGRTKNKGDKFITIAIIAAIVAIAALIYGILATPVRDIEVEIAPAQTTTAPATQGR